jgi:hypothetical protein
MTNTHCIVEGCEEFAYCKQMCRFHYGRHTRGKSLTEPKRARILQGPSCAVTGCQEKPLAKQLCALHYQRQRDGLPLDAPKRIQPRLGAKCAASNCDERPIAKELCSRHYCEMKKGKEFSPYPKRRGKRAEIVCLRCETKKPVDEFPYKGVICLQCQSDDHKVRYKADPGKYKERNKRNRIRIAQLVDDFKKHPCVDCGRQYEPFCMDFDHIGSKTMAIALMVHNTWGIKRILEEMTRTELVCVLCHKTRTHARYEASRRPECRNAVIERNRQLVDAYKAQPCIVCGCQREVWQMEFDHLADKEHGWISRLVASRYSIKVILEEIAKCQVVCALCHRRKTFAEGGYKNYSSVYPPIDEESRNPAGEDSNNPDN